MIFWVTEVRRNGAATVETMSTDDRDVALSAAIGILKSARDERAPFMLKDTRHPATQEITVTVRKLESPQ